jgi:hypothetical protein
LGLAQSDSDTAYVCAPAPGAATNAAEAWVTHDRGDHWLRRSDVAAGSQTAVEVIDCIIIVDALNPTTAVAQVVFLPSGGCIPVVECSRYETFVTFDSGQAWTPLHGPYATLHELATRQGVTYALFSAPPRSAATQAQIAFAMSNDKMRTWTPLAPPTGGYVAGFWLNPFNGGLLALTSTGYFQSQLLWTTSDGGQHWSQVYDSPFPFDVYNIVVQQPFTDQPWRICGADPATWYINGQHNTHTHDVACTPDGGFTWVTRHMDVPDNADGSAAYGLVGIADDGSVLVVVPSGLARFTLNASRLDLLGPVPDAGRVGYGLNTTAGTVGYAAGMGIGMLWAGPIDDFSDDDPQGHIFTASYA